MRTSVQPILIATLGLATAAAWAGEPATQPERQLTFEDQGEKKWNPLEGTDFSGGPRPTHVAQLIVDEGGKHIELTTAEVLQTPAGAELSVSQRTLMTNSPWWSIGEVGLQHPDGQITPAVMFGLYAVSTEDSHKVAEAVLQALDAALPGYRQQALNDAEAALGRAQQRVAEQEKRIEELQAELPKLQAAAGAAQAYKLDTVAMEDMRELEKMRFGIDVEIAGIRARHQATAEVTQDKALVMYPELGRMLIEQSIELAGALARRELVETRRRFAEESIELFKLRRDIGVARGQLEEAEKELETKRADVGPIVVRRNTVQIYRLE